MNTEDMEARNEKVNRCSICQLGFVKIGNLSSEKRLEDHLGTTHSHKCRECNKDFVSEIHLQYHLRYSHDVVCMHCNSYCGDVCSEKFGEAMSMDRRNEIAKKEVITDTEAELKDVVEKKIGDEHIYAMEHITGMIDKVYDNIEIAKLCRWIYLPTPMIPPKVLSQEILRWMTMDNYEAAIDSQIEDAQKMQIEKCAYRNCGFLFVDIQFHYWQYHP